MPDDGVVGEAEVFTLALAGEPADERVVAAYAGGLRHLGLEPASRLDAALLDFARQGPMAARCADAWCALFARGSALHRRLVLLAAILECLPPYDQQTRAPGGGAAMTLARMAWAGARFAAALAVGIVVVAGDRVVRALEPGT